MSFRASLALLMLASCSTTPRPAGGDRDVRHAALLIAAPHGGETAMRDDVRAAEDALLRRGFRPDEITKLETCPDPKTFTAALAGIEERIASWPDGSVFLYFTGHGAVHGNSLAVADPTILLEGGEIPWSTLMVRLSRWRRVRFVLFADCCYAGLLPGRVPSNAAALLVSAVPGQELTCRAQSRAIPDGAEGAAERGVVSYYALQALASSETVADWSSRTTALCNADVESSRLPASFAFTTVAVHEDLARLPGVPGTR